MPPKRAVKKGTCVAPSMQELYFKHCDEYRVKYGPKTVVLLQVGKFFQLYDVMDVDRGDWRINVQQLAELCGSSVQSKTVAGEHVFEWGFPEVSLEKYEQILIGAGFSVVVIVQKKDATGEVKERVIEHVSSPGITATRRDEQILLSIYVEPYSTSRGRTHWYMASTAFDVTTGKLVSMETDLALIDGKPALDVATPFWSVYPPAEVCFYWCATTPAPTEQQIQSMFAHGKAPLVHIYTLSQSEERAVARDRVRCAFLAELFHHDSALSVEEHLDITHYHYARRSLFMLLQFVRDHNPSFLTLLHDHRMWTPSDNVLLGNSALEQLGMLPVAAEREHESLFAWLSKASTAMGRRAIRERLLKPIADIDELERRQTIIAELRANPAERECLEKTIRGAYDLSRLHRRFQLGNGTTDDLLQLYATYEKAAVLLKLTEGKLYGVEDVPALQTFLDSILLRFDADRTRQARAQVGDAVAVGSVHPWRRGVFAELDAFETEWAALEKTVRDYIYAMEEVLGESDAITWTLKDEAPFTLTTTGRRGNVLVSVGKKRLRMDLSLQKRGSASLVQLDSPEIAAANAAGAALRSRWIAAVMETWRREWLDWVKMGIESGLLETLVDWMGALDCECTLARLSDLYGYVRPTYKAPVAENDAGFYVCELRHPIIERIHTGTPYIPHSLAYGVFAAAAAAGADEVATTEAGILLYGVNAAGKSSLGKAIGLAVLMAQTGMPVPATQMDLIPYNGIFTRILGNDNLWAGMSSFVVEMTEFRSILRGAGPRTLVISDELCAGTETASATSIVAAGFSVLANRGAHFFSATHLHELAAFPEIAAHPRIRSYHLTVHAAANGTLVYDRKLREGTGSPVYGLEVCRGLDMDPEFLTLAFEFRKKYGAGGDAKTSRYNAGVVVSRCEVCGGAADLETHHIVPQAAADARGYIRPGTHKNAKENLVVLCEACHTKHHGGLLEIEGWVATSAGRVLRVATAAAASAIATASTEKK